MYRKGVSALILNKEDKLLLVNLESFEKKYFAVPGGGIEGNESLEAAVYREIEEEVGIKKQSLKLVGQSDIPLCFAFKNAKLLRDGKEYAGSERYFFGFRFVGENHEISLETNEVRSYRWVSLAELDTHLFFEDQRKDTLEKIREIFPYLRETIPRTS